MLSRSVAVPGGGGKAKTEKKRRKKPIGELRAGRLSFAPSRLLLFAAPARSSVKELIDCFDAKQEVTP
jgi:hypothetical protein